MPQGQSRLPSYFLFSKLEQVNNKNEAINNLNAHLKNWTEEANKFKELRPFIEIAIAEKRQHIREAYTSENLPTKMQVDLIIIQRTLDQIQPNNLNSSFLNPFLEHAQKLLSRHAAEARVLPDLLPKLVFPQPSNENSTPTKEEVGKINLQYEKACANLIEIGEGVNGIVGSVSNCQKNINLENIQSIVSKVQNVITLFNNFKLDSNTGGTIAENLLQKAIGIFSTADDAVKISANSLKQLEDRQGSKSEIFEAKVALNTALVEQHNSQKKFEKTFNDLNKGIGLAAELISLTGNPKLANQLTIVGTAVVDITKTIIGWGTLAAASGPAAPFIAIGGAVVTLLKCLFNSGSSGKPPLKFPKSEQEFFGRLMTWGN